MSNRHWHAACLFDSFRSSVRRHRSRVWQCPLHLPATVNPALGVVSVRGEQRLDGARKPCDCRRQPGFGSGWV